MAKYKSIIITKAGLELIAAMQSSGGTIEFTAIKTGNGVYDDTEILSELTGLKEVRQTFGITAIIRDETVIKVRSVISNNNLNEGYDITEIGLFAKDNSSNEILYAIAIAETGKADYFPAYADTPTTVTNEMYIDVSNIEGDVEFKATVIEGTYVTVQDYNDHVEDSQKHVSDIERETWNNKAERDEIIADNLIPYPYAESTHQQAGISFTDNGDGTIAVNGTSTDYAIFYFNDENNLISLPAGIYTLSGCFAGGAGIKYKIQVCELIDDVPTQIAFDTGKGFTFELTEEKLVMYRIMIYPGFTFDNALFSPMLEKEKVAHPYQPYNLSRQKLRKDIDVKGLYGKTAIFFGDSITWGALGGNTNTQVTNPYPTVFGNITGCTVINAGVGGATASTARTNNFSEQVTSQISNIPNADYAFVCFGVNDFSRNIEVGNSSTSKSFYADYIANIHSILSYNPSIEIIVILPPRGKGYNTNPNWKNNNGDILDSYVNATIDIATSLNLRIVDFNKVGINSSNASTYYTSDNNHLTQDGYTLFGEHLAKAYKTGTYESKREFYDRGYRVATNQLGTMPFPNPVDIQGNSYYDGIYWAISGTNASGITSYKNVQILKGENYHFEFLAYHRDKTNDRTVTYTITMTNIDNASVKYVFKKTLTCIYERLHIDFYANNESGFYKINIVASGDDAYIASPSLSFGGIIPESRKRKVGIVDVTSTNKLVVTRNKFVNGEFIFGIAVTADVSTAHLARVNLNTSNSGDTSPYLPTGNHYFVGMDITDKTPVIMMWTYDNDNPGQYLLHVLGGIIANHVYCANTSLYLGSNNAVHEIIVQEY